LALCRRTHPLASRTFFDACVKAPAACSGLDLLSQIHTSTNLRAKSGHQVTGAAPDVLALSALQLGNSSGLADREDEELVGTQVRGQRILRDRIVQLVSEACQVTWPKELGGLSLQSFGTL